MWLGLACLRQCWGVLLYLLCLRGAGRKLRLWLWWYGRRELALWDGMALVLLLLCGRRWVLVVLVGLSPRALARSWWVVCEGVPPPVGVRRHCVYHRAWDCLAWLLLLWVGVRPPLRLRRGDGVRCGSLGQLVCLLFALLLLPDLLVGLRLPWVGVGVVHWSIVAPCVFGGSPWHPAFGVVVLCPLLPCVVPSARAWLVVEGLCTWVACHWM